MKRIVIHTGFHPETPRTYNGEHIYQVTATRGAEQDATVCTANFVTGSGGSGNRFYKLENNVWIKEIAPEQYVTDWTAEERWGRVEEQEFDDSGVLTGSRDLGFMILVVDRSQGFL